MSDFIANLKREAENNPLVALGVAAGLITAIGKFLDANTHAKNAKTDAKNAEAWKREVDRRAMKDARQ